MRNVGGHHDNSNGGKLEILVARARLVCRKPVRIRPPQDRDTGNDHLEPITASLDACFEF